MAEQTPQNAPARRTAWPWPRFSLTAALLLAANFIPLIGVIAWQWSPFIILALYWLENVAVGVTTTFKILLCRGGETIERYGNAAFFAVHYGGFALVHGIFVFSGLGALLGKAYYGPADASYNWRVLGLTALTMVGAHVFDFISDFLLEGRGRDSSPEALMWRPYPRLFVLHVTIIVGIAVSVSLGASWPVIALLVVLKTLADLGLQLAMRLR